MATIMRLNGKNVIIPKDLAADLAALKERHRLDVDDLTTNMTNRDARTNGRIDGTLISIGDLDTRVNKLETGKGENWEGPLQQEATRRAQADTNLKNQLDQEIGQRVALQNDYTTFRDAHKSRLDVERYLHRRDRTFVPRIPDVVGFYPLGSGPTGQLGTSYLVARRNGNTVHIQGELRTRGEFPANATQSIFDLPQDCIPYVDVNQLVQGTGGSQWLLTIKKVRDNDLVGGATLSRYRNGASNIATPNGAWLPINITYEILPLGPDGNIDPGYPYGPSPQWKDDPNYAAGQIGYEPWATDMVPRDDMHLPLT